MVRPTELDVIEKKLEAVMNGTLPFAIIRNGEGGRIPIFLSYKDNEKILVITMGGPLSGWQQPIAEIHVAPDGSEVVLSKSILLQVRVWNETEHGTEVLTGRRLTMCNFLQGKISAFLTTTLYINLF